MYIHYVTLANILGNQTHYITLNQIYKWFFSINILIVLTRQYCNSIEEQTGNIEVFFFDQAT